MLFEKCYLIRYGCGNSCFHMLGFSNFSPVRFFKVSSLVVSQHSPLNSLPRYVSKRRMQNEVVS